MSSNNISRTDHSFSSSEDKFDKHSSGEDFSYLDPTPKVPLHGSTSASDSDEDGVQLKENPFLDPDVAAHWAAIYEKSQYECRHVFDPTFTWTKEEEKKLVRRLDWRVCLWAVSC